MTNRQIDRTLYLFASFLFCFIATERRKFNTQFISSAHEKNKKRKESIWVPLKELFFWWDITNLTGNLHTILLANFRCSSKQKNVFHKSVISLIEARDGHLIFFPFSWNKRSKKSRSPIVPGEVRVCPDGHQRKLTLTHVCIGITIKYGQGCSLGFTPIE